MRRGTIIFIIFALIALAIVGASQFLRSQPPVELRVAVSPLIEPWARAAADSFNASNPLVGTQRVTVRIQVQEDLAIWQDGARIWTTADHPDGWIPALGTSLDYAVEGRLPFETISPSTAQTLLVWGIFASRAAVLETDAALLDWASAQSAAAAERWDSLPGGSSSWGFVKFAFASPRTAASGYAVLLSGAASFFDQQTFSGSDLSSDNFRNWITPVLASVPNFATLGANPAAALAPSVGEIALLPESQWLTQLNGINAREPILLRYPAYALRFEFPFGMWNSSTTTDTQRQGIRQFAAWLAQDSQQRSAQDYGLRPAQAATPLESNLFNAALASGAQTTPNLSQMITLPDRDSALRLLSWAANVR